MYKRKHKLWVLGNTRLTICTGVVHCLGTGSKAQRFALVQENYGSIQHLYIYNTSVVHYFGTDPKAFISVVLASALELSLPLYIPHSRNNKTDL